MPSKPTPAESNDHLKQRKILIDLEEVIDQLEVHTLDASQIDELNIKHHPMTLDKDSDLQPRFFAPRHNLPRPTDELIQDAVGYLTHPLAFQDSMTRAYHFERTWADYAFHETSRPYNKEHDPWRSMAVCEHNPFKGLYKYDKPDFGVFHIWDVASPAFPHMKAVAWNGLETESSKVCRGELLIILRLMLGQLRKVRLLHHDVAPIMIVSLIGKRGRLLESYFEGESLILRCSDLYDFSDEQTTSMAYKAFAEWYLGAPAGKTA
ncbi:hypothetical protein E8E15_005534 [Penicillium rubens]|uniref:Pc12g00940 protein n=2 Tax=Penicillium chrysogenum species complex TaxID=254878 RepID=B6GY65_PENRW|nr:uncharacterized protein N7525_002353 [Penicillium rubens]XP_056567722.1 uncharacterized protein N7489_008257 [Penicillium chrysogenum]CAP79721.1 Pc12g00940 [Penicillium rubens Wisconsin 54-1255]KAF3020795.1 hypothetical protein E8E15_005534 [Penicillium rubens]KAJ5033759.1 hypothetical protein NUH16_005175 [Penicillium rubens]KAJ5238166.1 hypothetical protein N7489_008257 [Penicillium chrysogenum]KAJ5261566.1 hypothetical protein N7505_008433 [Penicillium chrysogenum]